MVDRDSPPERVRVTVGVYVQDLGAQRMRVDGNISSGDRGHDASGKVPQHELAGTLEGLETRERHDARSRLRTDVKKGTPVE